jgi:flagellar protein FliS
MIDHGLSEYRRSQILGMSQIDLVITLYQGAIRYLNEACGLVRAERYDQSWQKFDRARRIVIHLCGTLNREAGDLAGKFASLYAFIIEQIGVANARKDIDVAQNCINILTTLKEGWEGLVQDPETKVTIDHNTIADTTPHAPINRENVCIQA